MQNLLKVLKPVFFSLLFLSILGLIGGFYFLYQRQNKILNEPGETNQALEIDDNSELNLSLDTCGQRCRDEIAIAVSDALADIPPTTETIIEKETIVSTSQGTDYISMGTSDTTTSTDWVDVEASAVYIDLENDYGADANVSWEASLKVAHGNGKAFARLYDDTNKIAVDFSELTTENNVEFTQKTTGNLPFWKGRNLYKVQIKSLNSFEVTYSGGKIKVSN
jgi:hypothetical protein